MVSGAERQRERAGEAALFTDDDTGDGDPSALSGGEGVIAIGGESAGVDMADRSTSSTDADADNENNDMGSVRCISMGKGYS